MTEIPPPPRQTYVVLFQSGEQQEVDLQQLREWARTSWITRSHQVYSRTAGRWTVAGDLAELADVFGASAASPTYSTSAAAPVNEKPWWNRDVGCGSAGCLAVLGIGLLVIYPPLGVLLLFVALVIAVVFRSK